MVQNPLLYPSPPARVLACRLFSKLSSARAPSVETCEEGGCIPRAIHLPIPRAIHSFTSFHLERGRESNKCVKGADEETFEEGNLTQYPGGTCFVAWGR